MISRRNLGLLLVLAAAGGAPARDALARMAERTGDAELRRVERQVGDGWERVRMADLRDGDRFRMFEPGGEPAHAGGVWVARGEPYQDQDTGVWTVVADPVTP